MTALDLTCKGRLEVNPLVNAKRVSWMSEAVDAALTLGGHAAERATVDLKESLATTDAVFSLAHLMNIRNLAGWDEAPREWTKIAAVETVDDFDEVTFSRLEFDLDTLKHGKGTGGNQVSPRVAEGDTYTYATGYTEENVKAAIEKRGFKYGVTLEQILSRRLQRNIRTLPGDMLNIALETDEYLVFDALQSIDASRQLQGGTAPLSGKTVVKNAPISIDAIRLALAEIGRRKVGTGAQARKILLADSYYIVVASGMGESVEAELEMAKLWREQRVADGSTTNVFGAPPQGNLGKIKGVIESPYIKNENAWYITPAAGASRRPGLVKLQLAGRTAPEVLVNNFTGTLLRGGAGSSPFDLAHFDNDTVDLKLRQFTNAAQITHEQSVWSDGSGK